MTNAPNLTTESNIAEAVVDAFGGLTKCQRALRHNGHSTIYSWVKAGRIPEWRWPEIRDAAEREGITLPDQETVTQ